MEVDCFKSEFGEPTATDVGYWDGSDPAKMHNYFSYLQNKTIFDVLRERRGQGQAVLFARSADHLFSSPDGDPHFGSAPQIRQDLRSLTPRSAMACSCNSRYR